MLATVGSAATTLRRLGVPQVGEKHSASTTRRPTGCGVLSGVMRRWWVASAAVLALVGCTSSNGNGDADGSASLACQHFRNVAADYSDEILTMDELRDKLKEVDGDAQYSTEPGVASSARAMLAAITAGDFDGLAEGRDRYGSCLL